MAPARWSVFRLRGIGCGPLHHVAAHERILMGGQVGSELVQHDWQGL